MDYLHGDFFCHYTTRDAAFRHILPARRLRLSPYKTMRDPLENKNWRFPGYSHVWLDPIPDKPWQDFTRLANAVKDRARLLAFTVDAADYRGAEEPFGKGWARARMWEHYAEKHAGVCLLFDRDALIENILRSLNTQRLPLPNHKKVRYTGMGAREIQLDLAALDETVNARSVARYIEDHHEELFFLKARDWETEYEYRFVMTAPEGHDEVFVDYGTALEAVVVGEQFPEWQWPSCVKAADKARCEPLRLDWNWHHPALTPLHAERIRVRRRTPSRKSRSDQLWWKTT